MEPVIALVGAVLEDKGVRYLSEKDLDRITRENQHARPKEKVVKNNLWTSLNPLRMSKRYVEWSMRRDLVKYGCNFAYIQIGPFHTAIDFHNLERLSVSA